MKNTLLKKLKIQNVRVVKLPATILLIFAFAIAATAQAYEPFNYTPGTPISGQNGGSGWAGPWNTGSGAIASGGLNYSSLAVSGNSLGPSGAFTYRLLSSPITSCSMRIAVLIKSPIAGTLNSYAAIGNYGAPIGNSFTIGDLTQPDLQAGNWGMQIGSGQNYYSNVPVVAGSTTYLVAQIDFQGGNDRMRLWVNPPALANLATGSLPAAADIDVTAVNLTTFNGIYWQTSQNQSVDEIRVVKLGSCPGEVQDGCCDTMRVTPVANPPLNQDYRKFEIFNPMPSSPICSIDMNMSPLPPTTNWQGGQAFQNTGFGYPLSPVNFTFASVPPAYRRLPTTTSFPNMAAISNPLTSPAVIFNLGFDNTQPYSGATLLTVNHCDGRKCLLEYRPWIVNPTLLSDVNLPWTYQARELNDGLVEVTLAYQSGRGRSDISQEINGARWLGLRLPGDGTEIYSVDGVETGSEEKGSGKFNLNSSTKTANSALFEFDSLLDAKNREKGGRTITFVVKRADNEKFDPSRIRLTLYDENANVISTGFPRQ